MIKSNIILIGMMGSGKTTIGRVCSKRLSLRFIDTDYMVENRLKMDIPTIFRLKGEAFFRKNETEALKSLLTESGSIISTGGGVVTLEENIEILRGLGYIIYLRGTTQHIYRNLSNSKRVRPLLQVENPMERIREILVDREEKYKKAANFIVDIDEKNIEELSNIIIEKYLSLQ